MIFSLVAMTGLEKCCITSAYLHTRGPLVFFFGNGLIDDAIVIGWTDSDFRISRALHGVLYLKSPGCPTAIGLQLGKVCYPCSR